MKLPKWAVVLVPLSAIACGSDANESTSGAATGAGGLGSASSASAAPSTAAVGMGGTAVSSGTTATTTASSSASTGSGGSSAADPVIVGAGDIACNAADHMMFPCYDPQTAAVVANLNPLYVFNLGDNQYENAELANYQTYYGASWGIAALLGKTRPVVGNHEYNGNANYSGCGTSTANFCTSTEYMRANYYTYFASELGGLDPQKNGWYSYDVPTSGEPWHVVVLNGAVCDPVLPFADPKYCNASGPAPNQYTWLVDDLASFHTNNPNAHCVLAMWHEPRFSSGMHGPNGTYQPFWQALYDAHAELVLNGHDHNYERFNPQTPTGAPDSAHGIVQITVGTGGRDATGCKSSQPNSVMCVNATYGVLKLTLHSGSADFAYVNAAGTPVNDAGTIACHD